MDTTQDVHDSAFTSGMFTFLVGPRQVRFEIHSAILEKLSQPLSRLMTNGSMKESNEKVAKSKNYRTTRKDLDEYEDSQWNSSHIDGTFCTKCRARYVKTSNKAFPNSCRCLLPWPQADASSTLPITFKDRKYGSDEYTHNQIHSFLDNQMPKDETTAQLTEHARVYVMADKYLVPSPKCLAIHKLHRDLVAYNVSTSGAGEVVDLLRYTYANTCGIVDDQEGTETELRKLVATYAACKASELLKHRIFRDMLEKGGEAALGFACFLAKRLT